jgi:nucleotide-binding universal stress UspA family protein
MFNRILVPLDGSKMAEQVLSHVELFARIFGSHIILLQVLDPSSQQKVNPLQWQIQKAKADVYMRGIVEKVRKRLTESAQSKNGDPETSNKGAKACVRYVIVEGNAAETIVNYAHSEAIDLLMLNSHGASGLSHWNLSSTARKVLDLIYLPVLLLRAYQETHQEDKPLHYRCILLPIDSSRRAELGISAGIALAQGTHNLPEVDDNAQSESAAEEFGQSTKIILTTVIKPPEIPIPEPYPVEIQRLKDELMDVSCVAVENYIREMKARIPVECQTRILKDDSVGSAIHELAKQEECIDLVVLCAHGYTGQATLPYGSVARQYIDRGTKPVLVIQDLPQSKVQPTEAEIARKKYGAR